MFNHQTILDTLTNQAVQQGQSITDMLRGKTLACFDIETTDLSYLEGEVIEIGCIKYDLDQSCTPVNGQSFNVLIKPTLPYDEAFTEGLTGISRAMLNRDGINSSQAFDAFIEFTKDVDIIVHQNGNRFDMGFLTYHMTKDALSRTYEERELWSVPTSIDTLEVAKAQLSGGKHNLAVLCERYGVVYDPNAHHRATYDCQITLGVFFKQLHTLGFKFTHDEVTPSHLSYINTLVDTVPHIKPVTVYHESQLKALTSAFASPND